jgi:hypothetical protein
MMTIAATSSFAITGKRIPGKKRSGWYTNSESSATPV